MFSNLGARLDRFSKTEVADVDGSSRLNCTREMGRATEGKIVFRMGSLGSRIERTLIEVFVFKNGV